MSTLVCCMQVVYAKHFSPAGHSSLLEDGHLTEQRVFASCQFFPQKYVASGSVGEYTSSAAFDEGDGVGLIIGGGEGGGVGNCSFSVAPVDCDCCDELPEACDGFPFPPKGFFPPDGFEKGVPFEVVEGSARLLVGVSTGVAGNSFVGIPTGATGEAIGGLVVVIENTPSRIAFDMGDSVGSPVVGCGVGALVFLLHSGDQIAESLQYESPPPQKPNALRQKSPAQASPLQGIF